MAAIRRGSYPQVEPRAVDLMTPAVAEIPPALPIGDARRLAHRRGARLLVVREATGRDPAWRGVTPGTLDHALALGLGRTPVRVALWETPVIEPRMPEVAVRRLLRSGAPGALLLERGRPRGAVLRETGILAGLPGSLRAALDRLPEEARTLLREAAWAASESGLDVWLVGGVVRDLALGITGASRDLDLVVEGDARRVARRLARRLGGGVREHAAFLTATVEAPHRPRLDLATARAERYRRPGALPEVAPAAIREDLWRRDFSINALAIGLPGDRWGQLLDPTGGLDDLGRRQLRILHPLSFVEDPTRGLRAVRLAGRLGFRLEASTARLLREALRLDVYAALSADRLRAEWRRVLAEPAPATVLAGLARAGALPLLGLEAPFGPPSQIRLARLARRTARLPLSADTREALAVLALASDAGEPAVERMTQRLGLPPRSAAALAGARARAPSLLDRLAAASGFGSACAMLDGTPEAVAAWGLILASPGLVARRLGRYLRVWSGGTVTQPLLGGDDVRKLGLAPGPRVGVLLRAARAAQLSGRIRTRTAALRWLRRQTAVPGARAAPPSTSRRSPDDPQRKGGVV